MVRNLGYLRKFSGCHEDDQEQFSGRPQPFSGRRGHVDTHIFLVWAVRVSLTQLRLRCIVYWG